MAVLEAVLAEANADSQKRLEHLAAKLADAERAKSELAKAVDGSLQSELDRTIVQVRARSCASVGPLALAHSPVLLLAERAARGAACHG